MVLSIKNLSTTFHLRDCTIRAVRLVSFELRQGETIGIVGESGSGKTVLTHSLLRLLRQPPARIEGNALFDGIDLVTCDSKTLRTIRGNRIGIIFQDPSAAFNPYMRLADQMVETLMLHRHVSRSDALAAAITALDETGISRAQERIQSYPHEFSGGMLQRAMIASILMLRPQLIIADEPTTALDVTVQAQLLRLMKTLQKQYSMSILFITHNLGIVAGFCDRVLVMYAGRILESAPTERIFTATSHPYTKALIASIPRIDGKDEVLCSIPGTPPDGTGENRGCPFYSRCFFKAEICLNAPMRPVETVPGHSTTCVRVLQGEITC